MSLSPKAASGSNGGSPQGARCLCCGCSAGVAVAAVLAVVASEHPARAADRRSRPMRRGNSRVRASTPAAASAPPASASSSRGAPAPRLIVRLADGNGGLRLGLVSRRRLCISRRPLLRGGLLLLGAESAQGCATLGRVGLRDLHEGERFDKPGPRRDRPAAAAPALRLREPLLAGEQEYGLFELGPRELELSEIGVEKRGGNLAAVGFRARGGDRLGKERVIQDSQGQAGRETGLRLLVGVERQRGCAGSARAALVPRTPWQSRAGVPRSCRVRQAAGRTPQRRPG